MPVDSDSAIAWHRAQLKKLREILRNIETARFTVGEPAPPVEQGPQDAEGGCRTGAENPPVGTRICIAAYERQTRRPLATDQRSLGQREVECLECPGCALAAATVPQ